MVIVLECPCVIHCCRCFPEAIYYTIWYLVVAQASVVTKVVTDPSTGETVRLEFVNVVDQVCALFGGYQDWGIKPDQAYGTIVGEDLLELGFYLIG